MGMVINSYSVIPGTVPAGTIRTSGIMAVPSTASQVVNFPGTAVAGDYMIIFTAQGFPPNVPSGWTSINAPGSGSNCNGGCFAKTLSSGDISTGSVTVTYTGAFNGVLGYVVFVGGVTGLRTTQAVRGSSGDTGRTITTDSSPVAADIALYWGSYRLGPPSAITVNRGTILQHDETSPFAGMLAAETLASGGANTVILTYNATDSGDYSCTVIIQP